MSIQYTAFAFTCMLREIYFTSNAFVTSSGDTPPRTQVVMIGLAIQG